MNKLFISPAAQEDLIEIKRYITEIRKPKFRKYSEYAIYDHPFPTDDDMLKNILGRLRGALGLT